MSGKARPWQKTMEFLDGLMGDLSDEELAAIKLYVTRQSREAAQVTATPVSTAQHCIPRSLNPEIPSNVHVNMEEKNESKMNPELTKLESSSAGTGLEIPGQQCPRSRGYGRQDEPSPTAIFSSAWDGIRGETSLQRRNALERGPAQLRHRLIHQTPSSGSRATNPKTRINATKRTSSLTPRERREATALERGCNFVFLFWLELWTMRGSLCFCFVFFVFVCLSACSLFIVPSR